MCLERAEKASSIAMNIVIINHNAGSIKHGMEFRPYYFAREWLKEGHNVTIVAASFSHYRRLNMPCNSITVEQVNGINYIFMPVPEYDNNGEDRLSNMQSFAEQVGLHRQMLIELKPNLVIDSSSHPLAAKMCHEIAEACGARYVASIHDPWELLPLELADMAGYDAVCVKQSSLD